MPSSRRTREDLVLEVAGEERVLGLQRGDRVHGVGPADGGRRGLGEPEVADLAGLHQLGHRADGLLDRDRLVDAVLVVEVDVVDAEPLQRGVAGRADVVGGAVDADHGAVGEPLVAELGGELDLVAPAGDRLADELLVGEGAVHVGGVEEGHAEVERPVDGVGAALLVGRAVELRHPHAAEAEGSETVREPSLSMSGWSCLPPFAFECAPRSSGLARPCSRRARSCGRWRAGGPSPRRAGARRPRGARAAGSRRSASLPSPSRTRAA